MVTIAQLAAMALALPESTEKDHFGQRAFAVRKKMFASVSDDGTTVLGLPPPLAEELIATEPETFSEYGRGGMPGVTVIVLARIEKERLAPLLRMSWASVVAKMSGKAQRELGLLVDAVGEPAKRATKAKAKRAPAVKPKSKASKV